LREIDRKGEEGYAELLRCGKCTGEKEGWVSLMLLFAGKA